MKQYKNLYSESKSNFLKVEEQRASVLNIKCYTFNSRLSSIIINLRMYQEVKWILF